MQYPANLCQLVFDRFVNRSDLYFKQWVFGTEYGYKRVTETVTLALIDEHLKGNLTLALPALNTGSCKWCCWDSDIADGSLDRVEATLTGHGWYALREGKRTGRDGHLWLCFDKPVPAVDLIAFNRLICRAAGVPVDSLEFFPKQAQAPVGSLVRLPLGIHTKPGAGMHRGWFEEPQREVLSQLEWLKLQPLNSSDQFALLTPEIRRRAKLEAITALSYSTAHRHNRARKSRGSVNGNCKNILQLIPQASLRRSGKYFVTRCPACEQVGWDTAGDNLKIEISGRSYFCVEGGPGCHHNKQQIWLAATIKYGGLSSS